MIEAKTNGQSVKELIKLKKRIAELESLNKDSHGSEEVHKNRRNKYKTLIENLPQKIFFKDNHSVYVSCNNNYARDLKINPDEISGKTDLDFYPVELARKYRADDKRIMKSGVTETLEERYVHNGKERVVHTVKTPVKNDTGNVVGILGIFWDITQRKQAEEALNKVNMCFLSFGPNGDENIKRIVETAGSALKGVCALYNKEAGSLLSTEKGWNMPRDLKKKDKKEGHICYDVIKKHDDKPFIINHLDQSPYAKTDPNVAKYKLKTYIGCAVKSGDKAIGSLCVVYPENRSFYSNELNILSILARALAIEEERKMTLDEIKHQQQKLEASEKSMKEFSWKTLQAREEEKRKLSYRLHDELGCMSVTLRSNLFLLKEDIKDHHLQQAMDRVNQTEHLLAQSVERLKAISRDLRPPDLDIAGLPNTLRDYFSNTTSQQNISIDFSEHMGEQKIDDEAAMVLYRATQEAINNILKHARAKKVKAGLYSKVNHIILTIGDDGRGFDVERRLSKTKGLGLRGVIERVSSLGGTFIIQSAAQKGTEIRITIPVK